MVHTTLSRNGYKIKKNELSQKELKSIKDDLTVNPYVVGDFGNGSEKRFSLYMESPNSLYIPRFYAYDKYGKPDKSKMDEGIDIDINFNGSLRNEQIPIIDLYKQACLEKGGGLISLKCGGGKTVLALYIISMLKKKTIVVVHKDFLMTQWRDRITQFLPNARIGKIQQNTIDIENKDIVIAMIQSISMKSYPDSLFDDFGLSIYDECHHISSEIFSNCLRKCTTLYSLGLSATMNRKDGLTHVFKMYLGDICYKNKAIQSKDDVLVKAIDYKVLDDDEYNEVLYDYRGNVKHTTMISKVASYEYRTNFILSVIYNEFKVNPHQQIILLSQTKNMLNYLYKMIVNTNILSTGYYVGGMKEADLKISEKKQVILATYAMAAEALDIPTLTTLVLATSKSDIVQAVGRILRMKHANPLIIDIIDQHECFLNQFNKRKAFYNEKGYKIIRTNNEKYIEYNKAIRKNRNIKNQIN